MEKFTIEAIRINSRMTVEEMAKRIGVSVDRWYRIERGETRMYATELIDFHKITGCDYEMMDIPSARTAD